MSEEKVPKWKRSLQQVVDELKHIPSPKGEPYSTYQEGWLDAMTLAVEKLERFLKATD